MIRPRDIRESRPRIAAIRDRGFTLIELVLVLTILAIVGTLAAPRYSAFLAQQRLDAAARRLTTDLAYAKRSARFNGATRRVTFNAASAKYQLQGMADPDHPGQPYVVLLLEEPYGASIASADFGGDSELVFDGFGVPDSAGAIVLRYGKYERTVTVDAETGKPKAPRALSAMVQ